MISFDSKKAEDRKKSTSVKDASASRAHRPMSIGPVAEIMSLQDALGNRAVRQVLQPKLKINQPDDKYEQEADRVADQVMRMPDSAVSDVSHRSQMLQRKCTACASGGGTCPKCAEDEEVLRRKENTASVPLVTPNLAAQINSLRGGGEPLPDSTRAYFEPRFVINFGNVRIHRGINANQSAQEINSRAYTIGNDIVFGSGQYVPTSEAGKRLLAHELTHVVQQRTLSSMRGNKIQRAPKESPTGEVVKKAWDDTVKRWKKKGLTKKDCLEGAHEVARVMGGDISNAKVLYQTTYRDGETCTWKECDEAWARGKEYESEPPHWGKEDDNKIKAPDKITKDNKCMVHAGKPPGVKMQAYNLKPGMLIYSSERCWKNDKGVAPFVDLEKAGTYVWRARHMRMYYGDGDVIDGLGFKPEPYSFTPVWGEQRTIYLSVIKISDPFHNLRIALGDRKTESILVPESFRDLIQIARETNTPGQLDDSTLSEV